MSATGADANTLFARAEAAFVAGRDADARTDLIATVRLAGEHPAVLHLLALVEKRLGNLKAASAAFARAVRAAPGDPQILNNYANLLDAAGDPEEALRHYDRAVAAAPGFIDARLNRALLLQRLGRLTDALADADAAVARADRPDARLHAARGAILLAAGSLDEAATAFDVALTIDPARPSALAGRARTALERGEANAVGRHLLALRTRPDDINLRLGHALAEEAQGGASAIPLLEATLADHPLWIEGHEQLARMRSEAGDHDDPAASFRLAIAQAPANAPLHHAHWRTLIRAERFDEVRQAVAEARPYLPDDPVLAIAEATAATEAGDIVAAEALFARLAPGGEADLPRARHLLRSGRTVSAAALLEGMTRHNPDDIGAWAHLSLAWRAVGDPRQDWLCAEGLIDAIDLDPVSINLDDLAALLRTLHRTRAHPIGQSLRGGTQTRGRLLARTEPLLRNLRGALEAAVARHVGGLPARDERHPLLRHRDRPIALAGSWSVRLSASGFHVHHIHPRGVLSSAFYVALPDGIANGDGEGWLDLGAAPANLNLGLGAIESIRPKPGRLVLFPSYMFHGTRPFASGERLTVAFDVEPA